MTAPKSLDDVDRKRLLGDLSTLKADDDDATLQDPKWFLPLEAHQRALRLETIVVRGGRGAGKSALFHFLGHIQKRPELAATVGATSATSVTQWVEGFGPTIDHPSTDVVGAFGASATDDQRRFFWFAWLCARLASATGASPPTPALSDVLRSREPAALADATRRHLSSLSAWLDEVERMRKDAVVVTYDALDRIGTDSSVRGRMAASLLAMWLSLADRYRRIRPKIFLREDLFQSSLSSFPDASKLDARSVSIEWRVEDLYRVLIKHMANTSDGLRLWVEASTRGIPLAEKEGLGWMPPQALPEQGRVSQKGFADHLAGEMMGSGAKKGLTYRWIPNRLQDAHARAVPRSILGLVRNAASFAVGEGPKAQSLRLLTPSELQGALEQTSKRRAAELMEEFPVVGRLANLRGSTVMLARKLTVEALSRSTTPEDTHGEDGEQVLRTLLELGVLSERSDGRIDVPDIYRYGFGILRKGGVKRPR